MNWIQSMNRCVGPASWDANEQKEKEMNIEQFHRTKNGLTLLQVNPDCAAQLDAAAKDYGWLYTKGADGQWVTSRKLSDDEIEIAHDQAADGVVLQKAKVRVA